MTAENLLLFTREGWRALRDGELKAVPEWPTLDAPTLVVTDFEEAPMASYRFDEGKLAYAAPMVEKRARTEGVVDGLAHILTHRAQTVRGGFQTFHSVVPLELWQRLQQWTVQQRDHCLLVPLGALLAAGLRSGQARVLRLGRTLHFFGRSNAGFYYASASALGGSDANLQAAVRVLAASTRAEIDRGIDRGIEWGSLVAADAEQDARLVAQWNLTAAAPATAIRATAWRSSEGAVASVLPALLRRPGIYTDANAPLARLAWGSERMAPAIASLIALIGAGLLGFGFSLQAQVAQQQLAAAESLRLAQPLEARVAAANALEPVTGFVPVADFARQLGDGLRYDPVPMLVLLREAAGSDMRIQRLRLESGLNTERAFQVDGVAAAGGVAPVGRLLLRLRDAGWNAQAISPQDSAPGAFSYRLTAVVAQAIVAPAGAARTGP